MHRSITRKVSLSASFLAAISVALIATIASARAFDESKYPDLKGQWDRAQPPRWLNGKDAPLTPEYRAIYEANLKDQAAGGQGTDPTYTCVAPGMPRRSSRAHLSRQGRQEHPRR
jgi:hypothetical protein